MLVEGPRSSSLTSNRLDNIYTVESESLQMVSKSIFNLDVGIRSTQRGVSIFDLTILWDTMGMLCLH